MSSLRQTLFPLLSIGLIMFCTPATAQIFGRSRQPGSNQAATRGPEPILYPNPNTQLSPSFNQLPTAEQGGSLTFPAQHQAAIQRQLGYNPARAWTSGATPDQMLKLGDLLQNQHLQGIGTLTLRQLAAQAGVQIEQVPLSQIPAVAQMTVGELYEIYPQLRGVPLNKIPFLAQTLSAIARDPQQLSNAALDNVSRQALQQLASNPALEGIPMAQLTQGDWGNAVSELQQQQPRALIRQVPELQHLPVNQVFPLVKGAISGNWRSVSQQAVELGWELAGDQLFKAIPELRNLPLGALPLDKLSISSLPGLADRPLQTLPHVADQYLAQIPGLAQVPVNQLPINTVFNVLQGDLLGRLDIAYAGPVETPITRVITGGTRDQQFQPEPCRETRCPHFELDNVTGSGSAGSLSGKAWVEGKAQLVPGGKGILARVNNGKEPTGIPVWGVEEHVKLSLEKIQEGGNGQPASAQVWANIQVCFTAPFLGEQCTPHFIPVPTPWQVKAGGLMLVAAGGQPPEFIRQARDQAHTQYAAQYGYEQECIPATAVATTDPSLVASAGQPPATANVAQANLQRYLARIAAGESAGGRVIGPNPQTGAYGEYQFTPQSRATMIRTAGLDPWSPNKGIRDRAALQWINLYGREQGVNILAAIQRGDFSFADRVLGRNQFTSLPGGAEEHAMWRNPLNQIRYGPAGQGSPSPVFTGQNCAPGSSAGPFAQGTGKATGRFKSPIDRPYVTSEFGPRGSPCAGCSSNHKGIDLAANINMPLKAPDGGRVDFVGWISGYGNVVIIDHGNGLGTMYAHLNQAKVRVGDKVSQGQIFALSGATGVGTGPHLHIEVYEGYQSGNYRSGVPVNPRRHFRF